MPADVSMTPEAAAVVAAFDAVMDRAGVFEGSNDALAAALRELAAVTGMNSTSGVIIDAADIFAIADSIENSITYAENQPHA